MHCFPTKTWKAFQDQHDEWERLHTRHRDEFCAVRTGLAEVTQKVHELRFLNDWGPLNGPTTTSRAPTDELGHASTLPPDAAGGAQPPPTQVWPWGDQFYSPSEAGAPQDGVGTTKGGSSPVFLPSGAVPTAAGADVFFERQ